VPAITTIRKQRPNNVASWVKGRHTGLKGNPAGSGGTVRGRNYPKTLTWGYDYGIGWEGEIMVLSQFERTKEENMGAYPLPIW